LNRSFRLFDPPLPTGEVEEAEQIDRTKTHLALERDGPGSGATTDHFFMPGPETAPGLQVEACYFVWGRFAIFWQGPTLTESESRILGAWDP
jgi:hypothetical protein